MRHLSTTWTTYLKRTYATLVFFLPLILLILVTQSLKEYFPFSHFPMYDNMGSYTYYVYVTDGDDNPIPAEKHTGERTTKLKRIFDTQIRPIYKKLNKKSYDLTIEERLPAGQHTLNWLRDAAMARPIFAERIQQYDSLKLYQVLVTVQDGKVSQSAPDCVGEIKVASQD